MNIEELKKEFYMLYGRFNSTTGELIGMNPPETIDGLWNFIEQAITKSNEEAYKKGYIDGVLSYRENNLTQKEEE